MPTWDELQAAYDACDPQDREARAAVEQQACALFQEGPAEFWSFFERTPRAARTSHGTSLVLPVLNGAAAAPCIEVPREHLAELVHTAVCEEDASHNHHFIFPCVFTAGNRAVHELLFTRIREGCIEEKFGAIAALHPALGQLGHEQPAESDLAALKVERNGLLLREFLATDNGALRHLILEFLTFDPEDYPEAVREELPRVLEIARTVDEKYRATEIETHPEGAAGRVLLRLRKWLRAARKA